MSAHVLNALAALVYLAAGAYLISSLVQLKQARRSVLFALTGIALVLHAAGCVALIVRPAGLALNLFNVLSLIFFTVNTLVLISATRKPVENLFALLFPLSVLAIIAALFVHGHLPPLQLTVGLASHVLLSILAYSLLTIATLQALFLAFQNYRLKHKRDLAPLRLMPPLQTMETLLFEMLWGGQILLTAAIISGVIFLQDIFAQHVAHKAVFTLIAWVIYSVLLWGRHSLGWRGYKAIRWTLGGFAMLMLAYFGSRLVLEFIL